MNKLILFLLFFFLCVSCKQKNSSIPVISKLNDSIAFYTLNIEEALKQKKELQDSFLLNDIAQNISFISPELTSQTLLTNLNFLVTGFEDNYVLSSGVFHTVSPILKFDSIGKYMGPLISIGKGPGEIVQYTSWHINFSQKKLFVGKGGQGIIYSFNGNKRSDVSFNRYLNRAVLLNDNSIAGYPSPYPEVLEEPYLYFFDEKGNQLKALHYTEKRDIYFQIPQGQSTGPLESYGLNPTYYGNALFKDVFNDTIYRVESVNKVEPYIHLKRGKLIPQIKDYLMENKKKEQVFFRDVNETENYLLVRYNYRDFSYTSIWNKSTQEMIANIQSSDEMGVIINSPFFIKYKTPQGKKVWVAITSLGANKMYCMINAKDAQEFLEGITDESNPVIMVVDLKNNVNL